MITTELDFLESGGEPTLIGLPFPAKRGKGTFSAGISLITQRSFLPAERGGHARKAGVGFSRSREISTDLGDQCKALFSLSVF